MLDVSLPDWFYDRVIGPLRFAFQKLTVTTTKQEQQLCTTAGKIVVHPGTKPEQKDPQTRTIPYARLQRLEKPPDPV